MHVRVSKSNHRGKTYEYVQIVESYRRPKDGMPAHRVVANLGRMEPVAVANLKAAFAAARKGAAVVVPEAAATRLPGQPVEANLRYLDVAVLLDLWRKWDLPALVADALGSDKSVVTAASVVVALVLQRCVAPGTKKGATGWFPTTALPELLGVAPGRFNNSRLHRVLDRLAAADEAIQAGVARRVRRREGTFANLFLDVTDTWFVGQGPEAAEGGKTKEGLYRRKIGIVALCDERGYPLRWKVVRGRRHDSAVMTELLEAVAGVEWAAGAPIVFDRAMGKTAHIRRVLETGLHFITALTSDEFDSYGGERLPTDEFAQVEPPSNPASHEKACAELGDRAEAAGMQRVRDDLFVLELGKADCRSGSGGVSPGPATPQPKDAPNRADAALKAMRLAQVMRAQLDTGEATSLRTVGELHDLNKWQARDLLALSGLAPDLQQAVLDGSARGVSPHALQKKVAGLDTYERQREAFEQEVAKAAARGYRPSRSGGRNAPLSPGPSKPEPHAVRVVACFNPELLLAKRERAEEKLAEVRTEVRELNDKLRSPRSRHTSESAYAAVERQLRRHDLLDVFDIIVEQDEQARLRVLARFKPEPWARRRRYDGFCLLVVHPDVSPASYDATRVAELYRAKDVLEKDFHVIKSVVKVRPVWHHNDPKVRAHVALCMLALLLCRTLERELARAKMAMSASAAIQALATCHLNLLTPEGGADPYHTVTRATREQTAILKALKLEDLVDDRAVAEQIQPR